LNTSPLENRWSYKTGTGKIELSRERDQVKLVLKFGKFVFGVSDLNYRQRPWKNRVAIHLSFRTVLTQTEKKIC